MKVSVAMTCYNGSKYIVEQLDSLRNQSRIIDEVCIVDDHSTDDTCGIIREYISKFNLKNWSIFSNEGNLGWIKNFHKAIRLTSGDIVFFCDQDDIWHCNKIEVMTDILTKSPEISVLACRLNLIDSNGNKMPNMHNRFPFDSKGTKSVRKNCVDNKFLYSISPGCTLGVKRSLISKLYSVPNSELLPHDALFWKVGTCLDCVYVYDDALMEYRIHANNASNPSATMHANIKSKERRIEEVDRFIGSFSVVKEVVEKVCDNKEYMSLIDKIVAHLNVRRKWIGRNYEMGFCAYFFNEIRFYRNLKMFLGDVFARR